MNIHSPAYRQVTANIRECGVEEDGREVFALCNLTCRRQKEVPATQLQKVVAASDLSQYCNIIQEKLEIQLFSVKNFR